MKRIPVNFFKYFINGEFKYSSEDEPEIFEKYKNLIEDFEIVEYDTTYVGGDPMDIWVLKRKSTGEYIQFSNYRDSWNGSDWEPDVIKVEPKEVTLTKYFPLVEEDLSFEIDEYSDNNDELDEFF